MSHGATGAGPSRRKNCTGKANAAAWAEAATAPAVSTAGLEAKAAAGTPAGLEVEGLVQTKPQKINLLKTIAVNMYMHAFGLNTYMFCLKPMHCGSMQAEPSKKKVIEKKAMPRPPKEDMPHQPEQDTPVQDTQTFQTGEWAQVQPCFQTPPTQTMAQPMAQPMQSMEPTAQPMQQPAVQPQTMAQPMQWPTAQPMQTVPQPITQPTQSVEARAQPMQQPAAQPMQTMAQPMAQPMVQVMGHPAFAQNMQDILMAHTGQPVQTFQHVWLGQMQAMDPTQILHDMQTMHVCPPTAKQRLAHPIPMQTTGHPMQTTDHPMQTTGHLTQTMVHPMPMQTTGHPMQSTSSPAQTLHNLGETMHMATAQPTQTVKPTQVLSPTSPASAPSSPTSPSVVIVDYF